MWHPSLVRLDRTRIFASGLASCFVATFRGLESLAAPSSVVVIGGVPRPAPRHISSPASPSTCPYSATHPTFLRLSAVLDVVDDDCLNSRLHVRSLTCSSVRCRAGSAVGFPTRSCAVVVASCRLLVAAVLDDEHGTSVICGPFHRFLCV